MKQLRNTCITLLISAVTLSLHANENWQWSVEPYLMATNIEGDAGVGRATGISVAVDTSDILETLEVGAMIHVEGLHNNGWGMMFDYAFMKLGDDLTGPRGGVTDVTVRQGVLEAMAVRRIQVEEGILDVYGGIRWWDNDVKITLDPAILPGDREAKVAADWVDPVVGVRYRMPLSEAWALLLQGDIGGLSLGSDLTFAAVVGVNYRFSDTMSLNLKYKGLWVDYEDGKASEPGYFMYDTVTHGLILGLNFEF